jgi:predicted Zn finger-like uncharacterized protein
MLTTCPSCRNPLRVQDEFLGRKVRCPTCNAVFEASLEAPSEAPGAYAPVSPEPSYSPQPAPSQQEEIIDYDPSAEPRGWRSRDDYRPRRSREKPGKVQAIAIMTLIGGILATINALSLLVFGGISSMGVCCFWPGGYYGLVLGIMAIVKGSQLLGQDDWRQAPPKGIAIMQIINIVNFDVPNCVMGILTLVFLNEPEVRRYYRG